MKKENRCPKYLKLKVKNLINAGWNKAQIKKYLRVKMSYINKFDEYFDTYNGIIKDVHVVEMVPRLGHKSEAYFDEYEMEFGYTAPSYHQLSIDEKILYDKELNPKDRIDSKFLKHIKQIA